MIRFLQIRFRGYHGFKLFLAISFLIVSLALVSIEGHHHLHALRVQWYFIRAYWLSTSAGFIQLIVFTLVFLAIFFFDVLERIYVRKFRQFRRGQAARSTNILSYYVSALAFVLFAISLPFFSLHYKGSFPIVLNLATGVSSVLGYLGLFAPRSTLEFVDAVSGYNFDSKYFDVAALAPHSPTLDREVESAMGFTRNGPSNSQTIEFLRNGKNQVLWRGMGGFFGNLGELFEVSPDYVTLHERTTDAMEFALSDACERLGVRKEITLLTTDAEYPSVGETLLSRLAERYPLRILRASVQEAIWNGESEHHITERIVQSLKSDRIDIVCCSHVIYSSGTVIDLNVLLDQSSDLSHKPVWIIDGAQAVGNIDLHSSALRRVEYYASCVHKWLMVPFTLGVLITQEGLLAGRCAGSLIRKAGRPFSAYSQDDFSGYTIQLEPYFAANAIITEEWKRIGFKRVRDHNRKLAEILRGELLNLGMELPTSGVSSSIVVFTHGERTREFYDLLGRRGFMSGLLDIKSAQRISRAIRVCVHYYHSEDDVLSFVNAVEEVRNRLK
jgi:selenocysteine lyase/cysteine desulfurase